jgi:hypothetical protein
LRSTSTQRRRWGTAISSSTSLTAWVELFRAHWSGESLRHIATWYGVTVGRLQTWETQLRDGGQLAAIMKEFGLPHASALQWSNGGQVSA